MQPESARARRDAGTKGTSGQTGPENFEGFYYARTRRPGGVGAAKKAPRRSDKVANGYGKGGMYIKVLASNFVRVICFTRWMADWVIFVARARLGSDISISAISRVGSFAQVCGSVDIVIRAAFPQSSCRFLVAYRLVASRSGVDVIARSSLLVY